LWLNTDVGVVQSVTNPGQVARWRDQSGNALDFVPYSTCGGCTCNNVACISPQVVNGHDAISCSGSLILAPGFTGAPLEFGTGDFAIAQVFVNTSALWAQNGGLSLGTDTAGNYSFKINTVGTVVIPEMNPSAWHALTARGAAMDLITDWGQSSTGPTNTTSAITTAGGGSVVTLCTQGDLAEVVAVKGKLSDADRASLMSYFKTKFHL
jgi:hypothetical protein